MEHKKFRILCLIAILLILPSIILNNYYHVIGHKVLHIKAIPIFIMFLLVLSYIFIYKNTIYTSLTAFGLLFCMLGDVLLALYDPTVKGISQEDKDTLIILGGAFFLFARIMYTLSYALKFGNSLIFIQYPRKYLGVHAVFTVLFTSMGAVTIIFMRNLVSYFIFLYFVLGFSLLQSFSMLRLDKRITINDRDNRECYFAKISAFLGVVLFNISDILLLLALFSKVVPDFVLLISEDLYWVSMYLIAISVVRHSSEELENGNFYYHPLQ